MNFVVVFRAEFWLGEGNVVRALLIPPQKENFRTRIGVVDPGKIKEFGKRRWVRGRWWC